jgi:hypothetical protein
MAGTINISHSPRNIDFIHNEPYFEFQISGYGSERKCTTSIRFLSNGTNVPFPTNNGTLTLEFFGHTLVFRSLYSNDPNNEQNEPDTFRWFSSQALLMNEFERKIKNNYLLSQYYDISVMAYTSMYVMILFTSKVPAYDEFVKVTATGTQTGALPLNSNTYGSVTAFPENWKLWAKFRLTIYDNPNANRIVETPESYFDMDENYRIKVPLTIVKDYFEKSEIEYLSQAMAPVNWNTIKLECLYAEAFGEEITIQWVRASDIYLIANGRIQKNYYDHPMTDWETESGFINLNSNKKVIPWGMNTGEIVRSFTEMPQYIFLSALNLDTNTSVTITIDIIERDGKKTTETRTRTMPRNYIYRLLTSVSGLGISQYDILEYSISIHDNTSLEVIFRRTYTMIEKPYNARIFLLQNKYGLLESFFSDNAMEEKTVKGNTVVLDNTYKIDITNIESVYTVRSGSKRSSELQAFKAAVGNQFNYLLQDDFIIPITVLPDTFTIKDEEEDLQSLEFQFILSHDAESLIEINAFKPESEPDPEENGIITILGTQIVTIKGSIPMTPILPL